MDKQNSSHLVAGKYSIEDLVDLPSLTRIFEKFSTATGFTTGFLSYPSQKVLIKTGWRDACVKFHRACPATVAFCKESNVDLSQHLKEFQEPRVRQCRLGLVDGATPIIVRGAYIAYLATGQVFFQPPDLDRYRGYAKEFGFAEAEYLAAIQAVPVVAESQFRAVLAYLSELATEVAEQGVLRLEKHEQLLRLRTAITERERADESLRESRELIDGIINAMPVRVFWKDKHSVYLGCNVEFARDAGCATPQDIIGKTDDQLAWREFAQLYLADDRRVIEGGEARLLIEEPLRTSNGPAITVMTSKIPLRDAHGEINGVLGTYQDITTRKNAEAARLESDKRYRSLFENMLNGLAYCRMIFEGDRPTDIIYLEVNKAFESLTGLKNVAGRRISEVVPGIREFDPELFVRYGRVARTGVPERFEIFVVALQIWLEITVYCPAPDHIVVIFNAITKRKRAEAALQQSEMRLRQATSAGNVGLWEWNLDTDAVYYSPEWKQQLGYADHEIANTNAEWERLVHPDDMAPANQKQQEYLNNPASVYAGEFRMRHKDGSYRWILSQGSLITDAQGKRRMLGTHLDLTEHKLVEDKLRESNRALEETLAELRRTQRQIIQHENLRVLGQMAAGIAHDFNNALAPVIGFSELLLKYPERLRNSEQVVKQLQIINTCASDAARMVRQMRAIGSPHTTSDAFEPLDVNRVVRQTIELTQPRWKDQAQSAGQTIHMVTNLLPVPVIYGAEFAIREALTNLIFNAVDAMPTGGTITLSTRVDGPFIELLVNDTGGGLTEEVRRRVFEPFFSTKGAGGHGLGLAMVRGVVQQHGGTVEVESRSGQGTTFKIRLPIEYVKPTPSVPASSADGLVTRPLRVLVVDDEPMLRTVMTAFLTGDGHVFETAASGAEALAQLKDGNKFDVVITDKTMPEMNGEQLAVAINQRAPSMPIILMTGFGDMMLDAGELPPHICTILCKPFTQSSLRAALVKAVPAQ